MKKIVLILMTLMAVLGCDDDNFSASPALSLTFSADTVCFDTVFSTVPSPTQSFWVHNTNKQALRCSTVRLEKGNQTGFRVNVQGVYLGPENGYTASDIEIRQHDSTRIFVEATFPVNYNTEPANISDNIIFQLESGREQKVNINASSWDALLVKNLTVDKDTVLNATTQPRVFYGTITVNEGATLTLGAGTTLYFHGDAGIDVKGRLVCNGTPEQNVVLRGDRLDKMFDYLPYDRISGQWQGLHFHESSYDNVLKYTDIHSSFNGIQVDSSDVTLVKLAMEGCIVHNCQGYGIHSSCSNITLANCQVTNTLADCIYLEGGCAQINNSTIAQFYPFDSRRGYALHTSEGRYILYSFLCENSIITGYAEDELSMTFNPKDDNGTGDSRQYTFSHCLIRTPKVETDDSVHFQHVVYEEEDGKEKNGESNFMLVDADRQQYNFRLSATSAAIGMGNPLTALPADRNGLPRDEQHPDAGCYQHVNNNEP